MSALTVTAIRVAEWNTEWCEACGGTGTPCDAVWRDAEGRETHRDQFWLCHECRTPDGIQMAINLRPEGAVAG